MNTSRKAIIYILEKCYPDDTDFAGPAVVEDIVDSVKFERSEASSNLDFASTLPTLAAAVVIIKGLLDIFFLLQEKLGRSPNHAEMDEEAQKQEITSEKTHEVNVSELIDALLDYFQNISPPL